MKYHIQGDVQTVFNYMVEGLADRGWRRCIDEHGICKYRGKDGTACAVGVLMPDATALIFDNCNHPSISTLLDFKYITTDSQEVSQLLISAQCYHDGATDLKGAMTRLAEDLNLELPEELR